MSGAVTSAIESTTVTNSPAATGRGTISSGHRGVFSLAAMFEEENPPVHVARPADAATRNRKGVCEMTATGCGSICLLGRIDTLFVQDHSLFVGQGISWS